MCVCIGPCLLMMNSGAKTLAVCASALISHLLCQPEAVLISISLQCSACGLYVFVCVCVFTYVITTGATLLVMMVLALLLWIKGAGLSGCLLSIVVLLWKPSDCGGGAALAVVPMLH